VSDVPPTVSVIVLGYNGLRYVDACLDSLRDQDAGTPPYEVVFFDNASTDGTPEAVERRHPDVRLVRSERNLGYAAGNVAALAHARAAQWVVFLNQDTVVGRRFVVGLLEAVRSTGASAAQANMILPWQPCAAGWDRTTAHPDLHVAELTRAAYVAYTVRDAAVIAPTLFVTGAAFIVDRSVLDRIGGLFDPSFWAYGEDTDLSLRLRAAGLTAVVAGEAAMYHDLTPSTGLSVRSLRKTALILRNRHLACLRSMRTAEYLRMLPMLVLGAGGKVDEIPVDARSRVPIRLGMVALSLVGAARALAVLPRHRATRAAVLATRVGGPNAIADALAEADARQARYRSGAGGHSGATTTGRPV
jgi:N-acetylglucosaminyl-diphospho-decaprenol L-rhamnosyltransferase